MRLFVIAGTYDEFKYYTRDKVLDKHYVYVLRSESLHGFRDIHGVFIGTWRERSDIIQILDTLITRTNNVDTIKDLYLQVTSHANKNAAKHMHTNPVVQTKFEQIILNQLADGIQKEINYEILRDIISS